MPDTDAQTVRHLYDCFNARDIDGVLTTLTDDVAWANGMDGGHVTGHEALREYWTRQWGMVNPHVEPVAFKTADGTVTVEVIQTVCDLDGNPLHDQNHGLKNKKVNHVFYFVGKKVARFDIA